MNDIRQRLIRCFTAIFPDLPVGSIPNVSVSSLPQWDSIKAVTLIHVVEDEFGVTIEVDDLPNLESFPLLETYLQEQLAAQR